MSYVKLLGKPYKCNKHCPVPFFLPVATHEIAILKYTCIKLITSTNQ